MRSVAGLSGSVPCRYDRPRSGRPLLLQATLLVVKSAASCHWDSESRVGRSGPSEKMIAVKQASKTNEIRSGKPPASAHQIVASIRAQRASQRTRRSGALWPDNKIPWYDAARFKMEHTIWWAGAGGMLRERVFGWQTVSARTLQRDGPLWPTLRLLHPVRRFARAGVVGGHVLRSRPWPSCSSNNLYYITSGQEVASALLFRRTRWSHDSSHGETIRTAADAKGEGSCGGSPPLGRG